jgi:hypothetical protein
LGEFLNQYGEKSFHANPSLEEVNSLFANPLLNLIDSIQIHNPWFTPEFVRKALAATAASLKAANIETWVSSYPDLQDMPSGKYTVGVIMAGNIPLVGFHDFMCVVISGHHFLGRLSSKDDQLLPFLSQVLEYFEPQLSESITFTDEFMKGTDAVIATGSDNSARYFEYYFGKNPHIIRKNRNSAAIISGTESVNEIELLADDIFTYFGLGCRNVSKLFVPENYDVRILLKHFERYAYLINHNKYANNYEYHKAVYLVNLIDHLDTGFLLIKEDEALSSPVGVLFYEFYSNEKMLMDRINKDKEKIQCIVSKASLYPASIPFGTTQKTMLWDYADNVDTLGFLLNMPVK